VREAKREQKGKKNSGLCGHHKRTQNKKSVSGRKDYEKEKEKFACKRLVGGQGKRAGQG